MATLKYHHHEPYCDGAGTQPDACPGHKATKLIITVAKVLAHIDTCTPWEHLAPETQQDYVDTAATCLNNLNLNR